MQPNVITDPWHGGDSNGNAVESTGGGGPLESNVDVNSAGTGPIREWVEGVLAAVGLTMDDLKVLTTVGNAVGLMAAVATMAGWL